MNTLLVFDFADPWSVPYISGFWNRCEADGLPSVTVDGDDFRLGRMPFKAGNLSITMDGQPAVSRRLVDLRDQDIGSLRFTHYPSVFGHVHADYAIVVQMLPTSATETQVLCKRIVRSTACGASSNGMPISCGISPSRWRSNETRSPRRTPHSSPRSQRSMKKATT